MLRIHLVKSHRGTNRNAMFERFFLASALLLLAAPASAGTKTAVFPFDIHDISQEGELIPQVQPEDLRRLKVAADELKSLMQKDGTYEVVDLSPVAKDVEAAEPLYKCDGCEAEIAKKAGAKLAVTGVVQKWSDALLSMQIFARDADTGKLVKSMSAAIQGNTDDLWLHGVRYLWKNRFNAEAEQK